ncbi:MAG TPA: adenylate/guanylate cyclase domain-containing protein [Acidimicrobiales bacterium]
MAEVPEPGELSEWGLYDPSGPGAPELLRLLNFVFSLGAKRNEVERALATGRLTALALDLSISPSTESLELSTLDRENGADPIGVWWSALGLPNEQTMPLRVTTDAAHALEVFAGLADLVGREAALDVARVVGSSAARMAEALAWATRTRVEIPRLDSGVSYADVVEEYTVVGREALPEFLNALNAVFRRHLVVVASQLWSTDEDRAAIQLERTVGFADLVGSTAVMGQSSPAQIAAMVRSFEALVWALVTEVGGRVVKVIGDEAMFVVNDPVSAVEVARRLVAESTTPVRVGLAAGQVIGFFGDYYGDTVNLAARLVHIADDAGIVVSESVRDGSDSIDFVALPPMSLKGFAQSIPVFRVPA